MKNSKRLKAAAIALAVMIAGAVTVYAAYDSSKDPLVSLSYLTDVFKAEVEKDVYNKVSEDMSATVEALQKQIDAMSNEYEEVSMTKGQRLTAGASCEIVILSGSATVRCSATDSGLIDCTDGVILYDGQAAPLNHKLLVPQNGDGRGVSATGAVKLLIKGGYTIG